MRRPRIPAFGQETSELGAPRVRSESVGPRTPARYTTKLLCIPAVILCRGSGGIIPLNPFRLYSASKDFPPDRERIRRIAVNAPIPSGRPVLRVDVGTPLVVCQMAAQVKPT